MLQSIDGFLARPAFNPATAARVFRIITTDYGAIAVLPSLMQKISHEAPNVAIEVLPFSSDAFRQLGSGQAEFALYSDDPVPPGLRSRLLYTEDYTSLVRIDHPVLDEAVTLGAFLSYDHILVSVLGGRTGVIDQALALLNLKRKIALWLPYFATAAMVVARSDQILTLPTRAAHELMRLANLRSFSPPVKIEGFGYRLLWHDRSHADIGHRWMRDQIQEVCASRRHDTKVLDLSDF